MNESTPKRSGQVLAWECYVPLINHPVIVGGLAKVLAVAGLLLFALVGGVIGAQEGIDAVVSLAAMLLLVLGGLFVFLLLIMLLVFGNRMQMAFALDDRGILVEVIDGRTKSANRLAALVGAAAGNPGVAGVGLMAMKDEKRSALWSSIAAASYDPKRRTITLRNRWRTVLHVFCTAENYEAVAARIATATGSAERPVPTGRSPLSVGLGLTAIVVLAILPLFNLPRGLQVSLLAVIITLSFALATIWLVPLMAWPALGGVGWIAASIAGTGHLSFDRLDRTEIVGLAMAAIGLVVLAIIAVAALRGKISSILQRDAAEMAGGQ